MDVMMPEESEILLAALKKIFKSIVGNWLMIRYFPYHFSSLMTKSLTTEFY